MGRAAIRRRAPLLPGRIVIGPAIRVGLVALGVLTVSGCALTFDATELGVPTSLAESAQAPPHEMDIGRCGLMLT